MFKKTDLILIFLVIFISLLIMLGIYFIPIEGDPVVVVYIDGVKIDSFSLDKDYTEIPIETSYGYNLLIISEYMAFIDESDCHTKSCVTNKVITRPGSMIICAPHHLIIKIETIDEEIT